MRRLVGLLVAGLALTLAGHAVGQAYPNRPIRVIVPFPPGGNVDVFARVLFRYVEQDLGQTIVIDNCGGANGILGADIVAQASPDGYTLLNTSFAFAVNPSIVKRLPFDVVKDFVPVTNVAVGTFALDQLFKLIEDNLGLRKTP